MSASELSISLRNQKSEISRMTAALEAFCEEHAIAEDDMFNVNLVLDEAVINVIVHGYEDSDEHEINVRLSLDHSVLTIALDDDGIPYNPLDAPEPRFDLPIEQRRIGGLGVHIMKTLARSVEYRRENGRNHLVVAINVGRNGAPAQTTHRT
jgi:serine/threonine-protein kinase RsbW